MQLNEIFADAPAIAIEQLSCDSRMPMRNSLFFCLRGGRYNGHDFVKEAIDNGAVAIVYSEDIDTSLPAIFIRVNDCVDILNKVSAKFYEYPATGMENFFVGGSQNRSLLAYLLKQLISSFRPCGYFGYYGSSFKENESLANALSFSVIDVYRNLSKMAKEEVGACVYENNLRSIKSMRFETIEKACYIYDGLREDDGEYQTYSDYLKSYAQEIKALDAECDLIFNGDDDSYLKLIENQERTYTTYGYSDDVNFQIEGVEVNKEGTSFSFNNNQNTYHVHSKLLGERVVETLMACICALTMRGYPIEEIIQKISDLQPPIGYLNLIVDEDYRVLVSKANNELELEDILDYAKKTTDSDHKIVALYGVGKRDDKRKRQNFIAQLVNESDRLYITENNLYEMNIYKLLNELDRQLQFGMVVVEERQEAIECALNTLNKDDILLILGKGDERYLYHSLGKDTYIGDIAVVRKYFNDSELEVEDELR